MSVNKQREGHSRQRNITCKGKVYKIKKLKKKKTHKTVWNEEALLRYLSAQQNYPRFYAII